MFKLFSRIALYMALLAGQAAQADLYYQFPLLSFTDSQGFAPDSSIARRGVCHLPARRQVSMSLMIEQLSDEHLTCSPNIHIQS